MWLRNALALGLTGSVLAVVPASSAHADVLYRYDATADVQSIVRGGDPESAPVSPAPSRKIGDVTRMRIAHEGTTLRVSLQYRALPASGIYHRHSFVIQTYSVNRTVNIEAEPGSWRGRSEIYDSVGEPMKCSGLSHQLDYKNYRAIVTIPRSCLNFPSRVMVGAGLMTLTRDRIYFDDAQQDGGPDFGLAVSPGVAR